MRKKLHVFTPEWSGSVYERYSQAWVRNQGWRVAYVLGDKEDQLQECAMIFAKLVGRYKVTTPSWFMALFKSALFNHWATLSKRDSLLRPDFWLSSEESKDKDDSMLEPCEEPMGDLAAGFAFYSAELKEVLRVIADAPQELLSLLFSDDQTPQQLEAKLCRFAKTRHKPVLAELKNALSQAY